VTDMQYMFSQASAFNHDISSWTGTARDVSAIWHVFRCNFVSSEIRVHRRRHRSGEFVQYNQEHLGRASPSSFSSAVSANDSDGISLG
jgi:hypothetical protein